MLIGVIFVVCGFVGRVQVTILRKVTYDKEFEMILNKKEKKRLVDNLTWPIADMKYKFDEARMGGGYSPELKELMALLEDIKKTETIETTGCHRKTVAVNCREFTSGPRKGCGFNRQGLCALSNITLERIGSLIVGKLKCVQAKVEEEESNGIIQKTSSE